MVVDTIENAKKYMDLSPAFSDAFRYLQSRKDGMSEDKVDISKDVYAMSKKYQTKPPEKCRYEAHDKYIDVQYIVSGFEAIGWAPREEMQETDSVPEKDVCHYKGNAELYPLHAQQFMILFPEDAHMPCVCLGESVPVDKIIIKIKVGK